MSKKHLEEYYNNVCKQYDEFIDEIKDFEECVKNGVVSPETISNIETMLAPLKNNWQTLSYVMYLLNMPNKKEKINKYVKQNKISCDTHKTSDAIYKENKDCIKSMDEFTQNIRGRA